MSPSSVAVSVAGVGDHDIPLFAISCIHKHIRSASSQPGCYTVLYFFILLRPLLLFPSIFPVVKKCSSFPFLITWPRNSACLLLMLLISFLVLLAVFLLFGRSRIIVSHHRLTDELFPAAAIFCCI